MKSNVFVLPNHSTVHKFPELMEAVLFGLGKTAAKKEAQPVGRDCSSGWDINQAGLFVGRGCPSDGTVHQMELFIGQDCSPDATSCRARRYLMEPGLA